MSDSNISADRNAVDRNDAWGDDASLGIKAPTIPMGLGQLARDEFLLSRRMALVANRMAVVGGAKGAPGSTSKGPWPLIRWAVEPCDWRQWTLYLEPPQAVGLGVAVPPPTVVVSGGAIPSTPIRAGSPILILSWGIGGARHTAWADYPLMGGVFSLTGSFVEASVLLRNVALWGNDLELPAFAASVVPGACSNETPLTFTEATVNVAAGASGPIYPIPPYARTVTIVSDTGTPNTRITEVGVSFLDAVGLVWSWQLPNASQGQPIKVPANATRMQFQNSDALNVATFTVTWNIGVS